MMVFEGISAVALHEQGNTHCKVDIEMVFAFPKSKITFGLHTSAVLDYERVHTKIPCAAGPQLDMHCKLHISLYQ